MTNKIKKLQKILESQNIDYFILPNNDAFVCEYLPESEKRIEFLTGFDGSNALLVVRKDGKNAFFTDGRYTLQAQNQLDLEQFDIFDLGQKSLIKWLVENAKKDQKIAIDGTLHSKKQASLIKGHLNCLEAEFISLNHNPIDEIWDERPIPKQNPISIFDDEFSGENTTSKIKRLLENLDKKADALLLNFAPSINWLLNIRSMDVDFTPLALCHALIYKNGEIDLFLEEKRCDEEVLKYFSKNQIRLISPKNLKNKLKFDKKLLKTIQIDQNYLNFALFNHLEEEKITIIEKTDPILHLKAIKNEIEIKNNILAHEIDGLALTKFLFWVDSNEGIDELVAAQKLLEFRQEIPEFLYPSFETISSFGSNGAIIHYKVTTKTNKKFTKDDLYLVDSGGQYQQGTTDVTRTILIGKSKEEHIENFTRVLKGHIAIARAKFPIGTTGNDLDVLARYHLWQAGKDYAHGTGHGVGQFLSVHESPPSISKRSDGVALKEGMILSNEPGYYENGDYGIRIENLMLVVKSKNDGFLEFKTLTLAPIDPKLINLKMMTYPEKKWLFNYHQKILDNIGGKLGKLEKKLLEGVLENYRI